MFDSTIPDPLVVHTVQGTNGGLILYSSETEVTFVNMDDERIVLYSQQGLGLVAILGSSIEFKVGDQVAWSTIAEGGPARIGFFGVEPIEQPSVTGGTTQQQVDSIIAGLVGLGLVTDDR